MSGVALAAGASERGGGAWDFASENDVYGSHSDYYYTSALRLVYVSENRNATDGPESLRHFFGAAQEMYTAKDGYAENPPVGDHPYSAWLYVTAGAAWADADHLDLLTVNAGVVGPSAMGEQVQNNWHRMLGVPTLNGWDTQLHDELGLDLAWLHVWRMRLASADSGWGSELLPRVGAEVGTVRDVAKVGVQWRWGRNLPGDFGDYRLRDGLNGASPVCYAGSAGRGWAPDAWYVYGDAQLEAWAHNMALDGNLFHDSRSVDSEPLVAQFACGVAAHWGHTRVAFSQVLRTREFSGQSEVFVFGGLTVTVVN